MPKTPPQHLAYFLHKLGRFKNYIAFSEKGWEQHLAEYVRSLADDALNVAKFGGKRDHWADLAEVFPQYHRRASFLMLFAMFEDDLSQLCRSIAAERKLTRSLRETQGQGIERAKVWLEKIARLDLTAIAPEWTKITQFRDLRNVLVHAAGFLDPENPQHKRVRDLTEVEGSGLELRHHARAEVILTSDFLATVIGTFAAFYELLMDAITREPR
jgi:hypothetical protein